MAEMTLEQIRAAVRFRGDYKNLRAFPNADVNNEIQKSFGDFWTLVDNQNEGFWDTETTITTVASTAYAAIPATVWRIKRVGLLDGGEYVPLDKVTMGGVERYGIASTDRPRGYRRSARGLELYPTPNAAYTIRLHYAPSAPKLHESQPREWYNGWDEFVIVKTLLRLDTRERKPLGDRLEELKLATETMLGGVTNADQHEPEYLNLREGGIGLDDEVWR